METEPVPNKTYEVIANHAFYLQAGDKVQLTSPVTRGAVTPEMFMVAKVGSSGNGYFVLPSDLREV